MPSSKGYVRNYTQERKTDTARGGIKKRAARNAARHIMMDKGLVHKGDGKDVDHKKALDQGGSTGVSNLRVVSAGANRSFKRNSKGSLVSQTSKKERKK